PSDAPSLEAAFRLGADPAGQLRRAPTGLKSSLASLTFKTQENVVRYGDYTAVVLDPVDGSFWITGEYARDPATWAAWAANVAVDPIVIDRDSLDFTIGGSTSPAAQDVLVTGPSGAAWQV